MGRSSALWNLVLGLAPFVLGLAVIFAASMGTGGALLVASALAVASVGCMLVAKLPAFRAGRWFTFGPHSVPQSRRWLWWASWLALAIAVVLAAVGPALW